jgi:hypothetical protein
LLTIRSMNRSGPTFEAHPFVFQKTPKIGPTVKVESAPG